MTRGALVRWLQGLEARELGEVLRRRPDALTAPSPSDLTALAARLSTRTAVAGVIATLPLPALQVVEALTHLGEPPVPRARLADFLGRAPDDAELDATLRVLNQRALVWPDGSDLWFLGVDGVSDGSFDPVPPAPALIPADRGAIRTAAGESADALLDHAAALLDEAAAHPLARQRNGGVAAREHARLAGILGLDEPVVAHFADVVLQAGLLARDGAHLQPTTAAAAWTAAEPGERLARLLGGWWSGLPLRRVVVRVLHDLPPDTAVHDIDSLVPLVRWTAPLPSRAEPALDDVVSGIVAEATLLGVCVMTDPDTFAISPLGRALADGRSVAEVAARLLPTPSLRIHSGVTVIVAADPALLDEVVATVDLTRLAPTVAISRDSAADTVAALRTAGFRPEREGPQVQVRRAASAPRSALPTSTAPTSIAPTSRPGPATSRTAPPPSAAPTSRHGTPTSRTAPPASAAPASAAPGSRTAPPTPTGPGSRSAPSAPASPGSRPAPPTPGTRRSPTVDPTELARRLTLPAQREASPLDQIRRRAPQLRPEQAQLLADAVEHGTPVWIRYVDANGRASERVIENAELAGTVIEAWCRLRRDDRAFTLDKIVAVARPRH